MTWRLVLALIVLLIGLGHAGVVRAQEVREVEEDDGAFGAYSPEEYVEWAMRMQEREQLMGILVPMVGIIVVAVFVSVMLLMLKKQSETHEAALDRMTRALAEISDAVRAVPREGGR